MCSSDLTSLNNDWLIYKSINWRVPVVYTSGIRYYFCKLLERKEIPRFSKTKEILDFSAVF